MVGHCWTTNAYLLLFRHIAQTFICSDSNLLNRRVFLEMHIEIQSWNEFLRMKHEMSCFVHYSTQQPSILGPKKSCYADGSFIMGTISSSTLLLILISIFRQHKRIELVANTKIGGGYYFITSCLVLYTTNSNLNCIVRGTGRSKILRFFLLFVYSLLPFVVVVFLIDSYDGTGEGGILYISYIYILSRCVGRSRQI